MAGSRVHKYRSILKRVEGLMKSEALPWKDRPLWYDVMVRFPPKVEPDFERPKPTEEVRKILYPEDLVRVKYAEEFVEFDVVNLKLDKQRPDYKTKTQLFVDAYMEAQKPGMSPDQIFNQVEENFLEQGKRLVRNKAKSFVEPKPDIDAVDADIIRLQGTPRESDWSKSRAKKTRR